MHCWIKIGNFQCVFKIILSMIVQLLSDLLGGTTFSPKIFLFSLCFFLVFLVCFCQLCSLLIIICFVIKALWSFTAEASLTVIAENNIEP